MSKSFSPTQIKVGDVISVVEGKFDRPMRRVGFRVTGKRRGFAGWFFKLAKMPGVKYRYSWDFKDSGWTAKELSSHYARVYRSGKLLGSVNTKYW